MGFAEDKVKEHISANLKKFQDHVRVAQMLHLRCFTTVDREEISSYERNHGNSLTFWEFFQRLYTRRGWVEAFIEALTEDQVELAEELREVYERHQLPSHRRNVTTPAASSASGSGAVAQSFSPVASSVNPFPPAEPAPSPRPSLPRSRGTQPVDSPGPVPCDASPAVPDTGDYSAPVQETELPSQNSEKTVRPKVAHSAGNPGSSTSPQETTNSSPSEEGGPKTTADAQAASSAGASPSVPDRLGEVPSPGTPLVSLRPGAGSLTRRWDSGQPHARRGQNGFVKNGRGVKDEAVSPTWTGAPNHPEENYYSSADNSPSAPGCPEERPKEGSLKERKVQALRGDQNKEPSGSPRGAGASPSQQQRRFDTGQERAPSSRGYGGNAAAENVRKMLNIDPASRMPDLQTRGNGGRVPAGVTTRSPSGAPPLGTSLAGQPWLPVNPSGTGRAPQMPTAAVSRPPPSNWEGCSSTDVIPPSSPAWRSAALSNFDSEVTKLPVPEEMLPSGEPGGTHASLLTKEKVPYGPSERNSIFHSNSDDDDSLCKPDVLTSCPDEPAAGLSGRTLSGRDYSGSSSRFRYSGFSLGSDSLQQSDSSQSGPAGERGPNAEGGALPGRGLGSRAPDASCQPSFGSPKDNGSIRTFVHSVKEDASLELTGAPDAMGLAGVSGRRSPDVSPGSETGPLPVTGADAQPKEEAAHAKPSPALSDRTWLLAAVAASVAVVAFVLLKRK